MTKRRFNGKALLAVVLLTTGILANPISLIRYALVIGSNTGNEDRVPLKYAVSDAESFAKVLAEMGGVSGERCVMVKNPNRMELLKSLDRLKGMVDKEKAVKGRKEAVVYYSGHADERGIILGREWFTYKDMRKHLHAIGVDVRIAVLDACASGSMTREKGGKHRQPFLYDVSTTMEGHAYLTSSSYDEASQESDAIKSSFFTHYLISGMRGPADANSDGKVTLNEAYEFAYDETLQRTEKTKAGPQHAAYDIRLKGSGDLVMTDLRTSTAVLRIASSIQGRIFIHDKQGHLLVELNKTAEKQLEVGLEPGSYEIVVHRSTDAGVYAAKTILTQGGVAIVDNDQLIQVKHLTTRLRGSSERAVEGYTTVPVNVSFLPMVGLTALYDKTVVHGALSLLAGKMDQLDGFELSAGVSYVTEKVRGGQISAAASLSGLTRGLQISGALNLTDEDITGLQLAGAFSGTGGGVVGVQISSAVNMAGKDLDGLQIAAMNYCGGSANTLQLAGALNYTEDRVIGMQLSGGVNIARRYCTGFQLAGGVNYTSSLKGMCIAGGINSARRVKGFALAGGMNLAKRHTGFQLAPVNICKKMKGFQLGVVNICDTIIGVPFGVFTYICKIPPHFRLFTDEGGVVNVAVRSGADHFYSLLSLGGAASIHPYQWNVGAGFGSRLVFDKGYLAIESMANRINVDEVWDIRPVFHIRTALIYGFQFVKRFCIWAGPSLNIGISWTEGEKKITYFRVHYRKQHNHWQAFWPGFIIGVEI